MLGTEIRLRIPARQRLRRWPRRASFTGISCALLARTWVSMSSSRASRRARSDLL